MADTVTAHTSVGDVVRALQLEAAHYGTDADLREVVEAAIQSVAAEVQGRIGVGDYEASGDIGQRQAIARAELLLCKADLLEDLILKKAYARDDNFPPEYEDNSTALAIIEGWRARADMILAAYEGDGEELLGGGGGEGGMYKAAAFGGVGIDETYTDDYDDMDYGAVEVSP